LNVAFANDKREAFAQRALVLVRIDGIARIGEMIAAVEERSSFNNAALPAP